jgi:uncharacterized membrane protein HdeD (DUF308 family)
MTLLLAVNWWSLLIRGLVAILFGVVAFAWPGITLEALVLLFGAYALVDGIFGLAGALRASREHERWGFLLLEGITGIAASAVTVLWPAITAVALVYMIGAWAVVTGFFEIAAALQLRRYIAGEWLLALGGVASVIFGVFVMIMPLAGALAIAFAVGVYAVIFGVLMASLGIRLRIWARTFHTGPSFAMPVR